MTTPTEHCRKCGSELLFRTKPTGKHDPFTGALTRHEYRVCPEWRPFLFFDNGHDWWHRGENPIDGVMPYGANPMKMENPPSPRGASPPNTPASPPKESSNGATSTSTTSHASTTEASWASQDGSAPRRPA